jgi:hypothetical protein
MKGSEDSMSSITKRTPSKASKRNATGSLYPSHGATRIAIRGVNWEVYDVLSEAIYEGSPVKLNYDGRDMELMVASRIHEQIRMIFSGFIIEVAMAWSVSLSSSGQTIWKRLELACGLEADQCYHFCPEKIAAVGSATKRWSRDIADYPNPDMALEINSSPPQVDRTGIYTSLQIAEIWRLDGKEVTIEQLGEDGIYAKVEMSRFLPVKAVEIHRWIVEEDWSEQTAWSLRLRAWLRRLSRTRKPQAKRPRRRKNDT